MHLKNVCVTSKNLNDKVEEVLVQNCRSLDDISSFAASILPLTESTDYKKVLLLRFKVLTVFWQLSKDELTNLNEIFTGRNVVVTLDAKESTKSSIYWKEKGFKNFVALKPLCDECTEEHPKYFKFIVDFLVQCLMNGQSGMSKKQKKRIY